MSSSIQLQQRPITLGEVMELIEPVQKYFAGVNDQGSLKLLGQTKEKLYTNNPKNLEAAVDTFRELHLGIPLEEVDARESSAVLWVKATKYYYQTMAEYNQN